MIWKTIGQSVVGSSHIGNKKPCEDSICYTSIKLSAEQEVLICAISDGAGSAKYAEQASKYVTEAIVAKITAMINFKQEIYEADILHISEELFAQLKVEARKLNQPLNEFSCTLLGCVIFPTKAIFFQVGDGAIVRNDGAGYYVNLWWPQNGEYQNTTRFLIDDENMSNFKTMELTETINEIAVFSDGLQLLALNIENQSVHQPFFQNMFYFLRMADDENKLNTLQDKLYNYLNGDLINSRTDDDKTLFLATRLKYERPDS